MSSGSQATPEQVNEAFLDWVNLELGQNYRSASDLNDGLKIYGILQKISDVHFHDPLPETSIACEDKWIARYNNLKHMGRRLDTFIQQYVSAKHKAWVTHDVDYKDLAEHGSAMAMTSLLKKVIVASIFSPDMKQHFEEKIREMPEVPQQIVVKTLQAGESQGSDIPKETLSDTDLSIDNEMMTEQKMAKVIFAKSRIEENYNRLKDDFDALKGEYDQLKEDRDRIADRNEDLQDRVISFRSGKDELADARLNAIKVESQLATITSLEEALQKSEDQLANFRDDNDNLRRGTEQAQQLQDELDEYKARQPDLVRKASAFEKYKEKVAQMQRVEAENREYRIKIAEIQEELKRSDTSTASSAGLRRELSEKQRLIEQLERDFHDNQKQVKELIMINRRSETRNAELEAEQLRNRNEIESLERKVEQREDSLISSSRAERLELDSFQAEGSPRSPRQNFSTLSEEQLRQKSAELESRNAELELAFVTEEEMRLLLNDMVQRSQQTSEKTTEGQIMIQQQFKSTIASGRHALKKTQQQLAEQRALITELTSRMTNLSSAAASQAPRSPSPDITADQQLPLTLTADQAALTAELKAAQDLNANLTREIRLMSSAWYGLQTRLQSPNVSVSRGRAGGTPEPKTWLGKQRKLVNTALMGM